MRKMLTFSFISITLSSLFWISTAAGTEMVKPGSLIKSTFSTVYYYASDGKRYAFLNESTYFTWYKDFVNIANVFESTLSNIPLGGVVTVKPGSLMVKTTSDPKVYAVGQKKKLHWITSEYVALLLYGREWQKKIIDVPESLFTAYEVSEIISDASGFSTDALDTSIPTLEHNLGLSPVYSYVTATLFWVGEKETPSNNFISNEVSAWDSHWMEHYGGVDTYNGRCTSLPCDFTPRENPFYIALPYNDLDENGVKKPTSWKIPWFEERGDKVSILKNTWVELVHDSRVCYAQWEDVGPSESDDFSYVFGNAKPKNTSGVKSGIDLSPALWDCLNMKDNDVVGWRFISEESVPNGIWKTTVTTSDVNWE